MDRQETFRRDTIEECTRYLNEVLKTADMKDIREIIITPMWHEGELRGWETIVRWIDRVPYVR